jgi:Xaa-Pro aminopeptidase
MSQLTAEKLRQARELLQHADFDVWLTFVRETDTAGDPALPLILDGGLVWHSALMVHKSGETVAVVGNYDADPIQHSGDWDKVVPYVQGISDPLLRELERLSPKKIGLNFSLDNSMADGLSHGMFLTLQNILGDRYELVSASKFVSALRSKKTAEEVGRIKHAIAETDTIFAMAPGWAKPGVSEREVYEHIQRYIDGKGYGYGWSREGNPIVNSGPDSMIGHGVPSPNITITPGHIFHIDLGIIVKEYSSDIQRCWYVADEGEKIPEDVQHAFNAVLGAIRAGFQALKPGVEGWTVDAAARSYLVSQGYEEYLHALGHQVGRKAHDGGALLGPKWERYGESPMMKIEVDHVYTIELGVILPGRGYLGLEEIAVVKESGAEWLSNPQESMPFL